MLKWIYSIGLLLITVPLCWSNPIDDAIEEVAWKLHDELQESGPFEIEIVSLIFTGTDQSTEFSQNFIGDVGKALRRNFKNEFTEVNFQNLSKNRSIGFEVTSQTPVRSTRMVKLSGDYREEANSLFVNLRLRMADGLTISQAEISFPIFEINGPYKPENTEKLTLENNKLESLDKDNEEIEFTVQSVKGNGSRYLEGEIFKVFYYSPQNLFLRLIYRDVNGKLTEIYQSDQPLEQFVIHEIPPPNSQQWQIDCSLGCGPESLVIFGSTHRIPNDIIEDSINQRRSWELPNALSQIVETVNSDNSQKKEIDKIRSTFRVISLTTVEN